MSPTVLPLRVLQGPQAATTLAQVLARWTEAFHIDLLEEAAQHAQDHGEPGLAVMLRSKKA